MRVKEEEEEQQRQLKSLSLDVGKPAEPVATASAEAPAAKRPREDPQWRQNMKKQSAMIEVDISESEEEQEEIIDALNKAMDTSPTRKRRAETPGSASSSSAGPLKQARFAPGTKEPAGGDTLELIHPGGHFMKEDELPKVLFPDN